MGTRSIQRWLVVALSMAAGNASAQSAPPAPGIFFGAGAGFGLAKIDHPQLGGELRSGAVVDLHFGWQLSSQWSVGGEFPTWGTSPLGTPVHLHTMGPRVEFSPFERGGVFVGATLGFALTEGAVKARGGVGVVPRVGYAWMISPWTGIAVEAGAHVHGYGDGSALTPFVGLRLRFHGAVGDQ